MQCYDYSGYSSIIAACRAPLALKVVLKLNISLMSLTHESPSPRPHSLRSRGRAPAALAIDEACPCGLAMQGSGCRETLTFRCSPG